MEDKTRKKLVTWGLVGIVLLFIATIVHWFFTTSYIVITTQSSSDSISYNILNQKNKKSDIEDSRQKTIKKRVKKGDYEVLVKSDGRSFFKVIKTSGFLSKTIVNATLESEKYREFVGDNPGPCAHYDSILFSYACTGDLSDLSVHVPATKDIPTSTLSIQSADFENASIGGVIKLGSKRYVYTQAPVEHEVTEKQSLLLEIDDQLNTLSTTALKGIPTISDQRIQRHKDGFLIYSNVSNEANYFKDKDGQPEKIAVRPYSGEGFSSVGTIASEDKVAAIYINSEQNQENQDSQETKKGKTALSIRANNQDSEYEINKYYTKALFCGKDYICFQSGQELFIYQIGDSKLKELYKITNVTDFNIKDETLYISRDREIISLKLSTKIGSINYSFGSYSNCGISMNSATGYLVCIINKSSDRSMIAINTSKDNSTNIDKKIFELSEKPDIEHITVYRNFIKITPNTGSPVYNPTTKNYEPVPAIRAKAYLAIEQAIQTIGFNKDYIINNPN